MDNLIKLENYTRILVISQVILMDNKSLPTIKRGLL
jgi:hypothetical protein